MDSTKYVAVNQARVSIVEDQVADPAGWETELEWKSRRMLIPNGRKMVSNIVGAEFRECRSSSQSMPRRGPKCWRGLLGCWTICGLVKGCAGGWLLLRHIDSTG